jgi:hypothetical protein
MGWAAPPPAGWYPERVGDDDEIRIAATRTDELRFEAISDRPRPRAFVDAHPHLFREARTVACRQVERSRRSQLVALAVPWVLFTAPGLPSRCRNGRAGISPGPRASGRSLAFALWIAVLLWPPQALRAEDDAPAKAPAPLAEYQLKAAFLYRLPSFIEWPSGSWPAAGDPFYACVLGRDPFGAYLDYFDGKSVRDRRFTVRRLAALEAGDTCHLVFVSRDEETDLSAVLPELHGRYVLTVGEGREFAARGGIVSFVVAKQRIGLAVNLDASRDAGLEISSKLLDVAAIVDGGE